MEHEIHVSLPEVHPGFTVNTGAQVNIHTSDWDAFRDALAWLLSLGKGDPRVGTSGPTVWVDVRSEEVMHTVEYILFAPHSEPSLGVSRVEYVELALTGALLRP